MKANLTTHVFEGVEVHTVIVDNVAWFVAKDVCKCLDVNNRGQALTRLDEDEKVLILTDTVGGKQKMVYINESGLYSLVLSSRKPEAKAFKKWVTSVVLPAIRKTGGYILGEEHVESEEELVLRAMQALERKVAAMKPKAEYYDGWMTSEGSYLVTEVAKQLGISAQKLNIFLRNHNIIWLNKELPRAGYESWFKLIDVTYTKPGVGLVIDKQLRVTPAGVTEIVDMYKGCNNSLFSRNR